MNDAIVDRARRSLLRPWALQPRYALPVIAGGRGAKVWDADGNLYLDLMAQLANVNLGYQDPRIIAALQKQAELLCYAAPNFVTDTHVELAEALVAVSPSDSGRVFYTTSGSEANEAAVQLARLITGRDKLITRYRSYHGSTLAMHAASGGLMRLPARPAGLNVIHALEQYCYRCPFGQSYPGCKIECVEQFERLIHLEGVDEVAAILVEPIAANDGVLVPPAEYLPRLRELCTEYGIMLIFDEVLTGFGRTGRWFAAEHWDTVPDLMTVSKGLTSGYAALGAVVVAEGVAEHFDTSMLPFGFTNGGQALACAVALAVIDAYQQDGLIERADRAGTKLMGMLSELADRHESIGEVRGRGLMVGVELVLDRDTRAPVAPTLAAASAGTEDLLTPFKGRLLERGLLMQLRGNVLRFYPPLCITDDELAEGVAIVDEELGAVDALASEHGR